MALTKITLTGASETIKAGMTKVNDIIDDLAATSSGLGASCVGILDTGGYMSSENVEDALAEIYTDTSTARTLSGTFEEDATTTTGLTWGYTAGTVRFDNTVTTVAAGTISLTDDATNYIEINSSGTVSRNTTGFTSGRIPIRTVVCASGVQTTSTDRRSWFQSWDMPLPVAKGGTGAATLTDHGILLGSGTSAVTPLGAATNGQIPIGSTGADPVLATITGTANQITSTAGAGTITLSIPDTAAITFSNTGLHLLDTNASHDLIIKPGSDLTADKTLTITTGDADRTVTLSGNLTVAGDTTISVYGATLTDDADAATARTTLGAEASLVGRIIPWPTETPPTGYLECDGASLDRTTYAALFAVIGTMYGTADGTHFNLPDYRGRFLRSWAHGSTNDPDRAARTAPTATGATITAGDHVGTEQASDYKAHTHTANGTVGGSYNWALGGALNTGTVTTSTSPSTGGNETRPINTNIMFCIKY
jgi:microcystin-dependent protein